MRAPTSPSRWRSGGSVTTAKVEDGAKPSKRVAFVREVEGEPLAVYVVDQSLYAEIYDGYEERFGKDPSLLPPGTFVTIVSPELYQSFNALFVVAFTPLVVWFFGMIGRKGLQISTAQKVFWGLVLTTASMVLMAVAGMMSDGGSLKVSGMWLVGFYGVVIFLASVEFRWSGRENFFGARHLRLRWFL